MYKIKKILMLGDAIMIPSGVGVISKYIALGLKAKGYDIVQVGGAIKHENYDVKEYEGIKVYPVEGYGNPHSLRNIITQEQPDALLIFTDPRFWDWLWRIEDEIRVRMPLLYYHLWDNSPFNKNHYNAKFYSSTDSLICISKLTANMVYDIFKNSNEYTLMLTNRAKDVIEGHSNKTGDKKIFLDYIPHGHPEDIFKPIDKNSEQYKAFIIELMGEDKDKYKFVVYYNNRNIRRKMPGDIMLAFSEFVKALDEDKRNECLLLMHTQACDENGTDLPAIHRDLFPDINIKFSEKKVQPEFLNVMYNYADVTINIASAEGYGIATAESLLAGTPIIANVTGGLQDQLGLPKLQSDAWRDHYYFDKKMSEHGEWVQPVYPKTRSLTGSPLTPYIFDDRSDWRDATIAMKYWYDKTNEERREAALKGRQYLINNGHTIKTMIDNFDDSIKNIEENWTPRKRISISKL